MAKFQIVKTVSYDLTAEIELAEASNAREALAILEKDGDSWVEYEQSDGNDEVYSIYPIKEQDEQN